MRLHGLPLPEEAEGYESEDAEEGEDEGEGFGEIGEAEGETHESGVTEMVGGEMFQQSARVRREEMRGAGRRGGLCRC